MAAPAYPAFVGLALLLGVGVVALARASATRVDPQEPVDEGGGLPVVRERSLPIGALLLNVLLTHGVLTVVLVGTAWGTAIPATALGVGPTALERSALLVGAVAGVGLYLLDEGMTVLARVVGVVPEEALRESLSPGSRGGWVVLLVGVLPVVAVAEELLFRGALVGAATVGLGVPAWAAVGGSSLLFGAAHSVQGPGGIAVTGVLGVALAGVFLATGSLVAVVVAHYVVNAAEFVVHEWAPVPAGP